MHMCRIHMLRVSLYVLQRWRRVEVINALAWCLPVCKSPSKIHVRHLAFLEFKHHSWVEHRNAQRCTSIDSLVWILELVFFITRLNLTRAIFVFEKSLHKELRVE